MVFQVRNGLTRRLSLSLGILIKSYINQIHIIYSLLCCLAMNQISGILVTK